MQKIKSKKLDDLKKKLDDKENKKPYWELEEPEVIKKDNLEIEHYKQAGALQIKLYKNNYVSKSVSLRRFILQKEPELLNAIADIFNEWKEEAS